MQKRAQTADYETMVGSLMEDFAQKIPDIETQKNERVKVSKQEMAKYKQAMKKMWNKYLLIIHSS